MSVRVRRRQQADDELLHYVDTIADDKPEAALRLIDAVEKACDLLRENPEMAPLLDTDHPRLVGLRLRKLVLPDFPNYILFYRFEGEVVDILHVMHAKLDYERLLP